MSAVTMAESMNLNLKDLTGKQKAINEGIEKSAILNLEIKKVNNSIFLDDDLKSYINRGNLIITNAENEKYSSIGKYLLVFPYNQSNRKIANSIIDACGNNFSMERDNGAIGIATFESVLKEDEISTKFESKPEWGLFNLNPQKGQGKSY